MSLGCTNIKIHRLSCFICCWWSSSWGPGAGGFWKGSRSRHQHLLLSSSPLRRQCGLVLSQYRRESESNGLAGWPRLHAVANAAFVSNQNSRMQEIVHTLHNKVQASKCPWKAALWRAVFPWMSELLISTRSAPWAIMCERSETLPLSAALWRCSFRSTALERPSRQQKISLCQVTNELSRYLQPRSGVDLAA